MIRLAKSTYRKVAESVAKFGLCPQIEHLLDDCHICSSNTWSVLKWTKTTPRLKQVWCLCDYHKREVGVLW